MTAYLIILGATFPGRKPVQDFLDQIQEVGYWYGCLPRCIFATSSLTANQLAQKIGAQFPGRRFLVIEAHTNRQGILPRRAWHLLRNPDNPKLE
jgi:hypothetical protein